MSDQHLIGSESGDQLSGAEGNACYNEIHGTAADDMLFGTAGADRFWGEGGADYMYGELGDDVYLPGPLFMFSAGDVISDTGGNDELHLAGVNPDDVQRHRVGDDLIFHTFLQGPIVRFAGWFAGPDNQVERIVFDDGTEWDAAETSALRVFGTPADDYVFGSFYGERLEGRGGSDQMFGYEGDDVYVQGPQPTPFSGADTIWELGGNDELRLEGANPDDVQRHRVGDDLIFHTFLQGPIVRFAGWFAGPDNQVERVVFDDGTEWDAAEFFGAARVRHAGRRLRLRLVLWRAAGGARRLRPDVRLRGR